MFCNGACAFCSVPCIRENKGKIREISSNFVEKLQESDIQVENIGTYEVKKNLFGKEKVRKVKNESRTLGIEYTP